MCCPGICRTLAYHSWFYRTIYACEHKWPFGKRLSKPSSIRHKVTVDVIGWGRIRIFEKHVIGNAYGQHINPTWRKHGKFRPITSTASKSQSLGSYLGKDRCLYAISTKRSVSRGPFAPYKNFRRKGNTSHTWPWMNKRRDLDPSLTKIPCVCRL